ncbi:hypothetical protein BDR26DRAFT_238465 [Obelidium mucronatum]|nr:hypothetical protein BDR26DRAFT_238465 [Obelidium mucronatum]
MQNSHISLSTIPACIRPGDPIVINWRLEGLTVSKYDWIGVYTSSRCSSSRCPPYPDASDPALAKTNSRSLNWGGSAVLTVHKVDTYRAYYFASNKYEIAATSNTFIVSTTCPPIYQLAIIEKQKCFTPKSLIHFSWNSTHSAEAMGWVGIYSLGQCIKTAVNGLSCPIESHFRSRINANSPKSLTSGNLSARIPFKALTYPPTTYFGYYLLNESRFAGAVSDGFVVRSNCPQDEPITLSDISLCIRPGDLIAVHWTSKEPASDRDWIGIYSTERCTNAIESRCPSGSDAWNYVSLSGGVSSRYSGYNYIIAPTSGSYQAYYFSNDMYSIKAISNTFTVSDSCPPLYNIATTDAECYTVDSVIKFEWSALPGAGPADWIGVYGSNSCEPGIGSKCPPGSKWWLPLSKSVSGSKTQGVLSMKIPSTALADPPSVYRGYFMLNDMYTVAAYSNSFAVRSSCTSNDLATTPVLSSVSNTVVAGGFMNVSWLNSSTANMDDRIMFTISDHPSETNYLSDCWQYTYGDTIQRHQSPPKAGSVSIKAPAIPGSYKVYYCLNNGFNCPSSLDIIVTEPVVTCLGTGETASNIKHVITIISENHSFDSYFGRYCQAPFGTNPACHTGPSCCEAFNPIPGLNPTLLNDVQNIAFDPCHSQECEICEMNGGLMDSYTASQNKTCPGANDRNFAIADGSTGSANQYWKWAHRYAMS